MAPAPQSDPAAKVAFVSGAAASAGVLAGLHARLLLIPPYKTAVALLRRLGFSGRSVVIAVPYLWLLAFFLAPFLIVLKISFAEIQVAMPPYTPLVTFVDEDRKSTRLNSSH